MHILIVVNDPKDWTLSIPGVELVAARSYLAEPRYSNMRRVRLFNLCRSYRYQHVGYYVSLLAEARGHRPIPSVATIQDMKSQALARVYSSELDTLIQSALTKIRNQSFVLSVYFGSNMAKRYQTLCQQLFALFPAPLLRASFGRDVAGNWHLLRINPITAAEIPNNHQSFVTSAATEYFLGRRRFVRRAAMRYNLAILYNAQNMIKPSNEQAIARFVRAARRLAIDAEVVGAADLTRVAEYDALFIRETTAVNHYTYRLARRAAAEGLAVIDDPDSILRCTNKVYLAQLLRRYRISHPKTMLIHRDNVDAVVATLGLPCVLKKPDGSFSVGVVKVSSGAALQQQLGRLLQRSEMVVGQEYIPTPFDWRVGVLDGVPLYVCKYHMAKNHWQIVKRLKDGEPDYGKIESIAVEQAPLDVLAIAIRAANLVGDGLYGVDLKKRGQRVDVIEVNDNPNIDAGFEDLILEDVLYQRIMEAFLKRIEHRSRSHNE